MLLDLRIYKMNWRSMPCNWTTLECRSFEEDKHKLPQRVVDVDGIESSPTQTGLKAKEVNRKVHSLTPWSSLVTVELHTTLQ